MSKLKDFAVFSEGLCICSVCTSLTVDEMLERVNAENPTGIESQWEISGDETFKTGEPNPCPCNVNPLSHKHYLLEC
jgi:hypothetical protein